MKELIVIAGPTASGKTSLAIQLAQELNAEIINADSRQFYRKLDIGTAKPTPSELTAVKHHFIDIHNPDEYYSAGEFEKDVMEFLDAYYISHDRALLIGGSGLYIKAVLEGFDDLPRDEELRAKLNERLQTEGLESLQFAIKGLDPEFSKTEDFKNPQRVIRALETMELTGKRWSDLQTGQIQKRDFKIRAFYLNPNREHLYDRINARVESMIANGLEDEVSSLSKYRESNALQTVGYKEWFQHQDGIFTRDEAISKIKQPTRNYAKRQITWFKKQRGFIEICDSAYDSILKHLNQS